MDPIGNSSVKFVLKETQGKQGVHVEEILHGNTERISRTSLLVRGGASHPALRTGRPVRGSREMRAFCERILRGVNTMRPLTRLASRASPARRPSLRRKGLGKTT